MKSRYLDALVCIMDQPNPLVAQLDAADTIFRGIGTTPHVRGDVLAQDIVVDGKFCDYKYHNGYLIIQWSNKETEVYQRDKSFNE